MPSADVPPMLDRKLDFDQRGGRHVRSTAAASAASCAASRSKPGIMADHQQAARHRHRPTGRCRAAARSRHHRFARRICGVKLAQPSTAFRPRAAPGWPGPGRSASPSSRISWPMRSAFARPRSLSDRSKSPPSSESRSVLAWRSRVSVFMRPSSAVLNAGRAKKLRPAPVPAPHRAAPAKRAPQAGRRSAAATASRSTGSRTVPDRPSRRISRPNACASRARTTRSSNRRCRRRPSAAPRAAPSGAATARAPSPPAAATRPERRPRRAARRCRAATRADRRGKCRPGSRCRSDRHAARSAAARPAPAGRRSAHGPPSAAGSR